ncbi:glutathione transferase GstA [Noviherbaspirillum sp.]|uniref:glutathione transferase GstA n=1 Tax=Noviherbaspirillum sp. TaxID=1926288 RepID=UPI002D422CFD|nr:glutathione transferase GstA [Noviherbaspirillum sp.]HZW23293.1 glutathione transferase GstA [Noviherbaspirillum sp.]
MKLYYSTGACSLSPHIVLRELGFSFDLERVNLASKKTAGGEDYLEVNPKGYVPALVLDNGEVLTEGPAIVQYLADQAPEKQLAPAAGTMPRYHLVEWLNFISTELHKTFSPLFKPNTPEETKQASRDTIAARLHIVEKQLQGRDYLTGNQFSVADAYLFTVLCWARPMKFDLGQWPAVQAYMQRVAARPAVHEAMKAEGLIKE